MNILVTGSHGLIGSAAVRFFRSKGYRVSRLIRTAASAGSKSDEPEMQWDPQTGATDEGAMEGFDAVVHLAGENLSSGRWKAEMKSRIRDSRVEGARLLSERLSRLQRRPRVLVSASAVGYYGDRGDEVLREESESGTTFLAEVVQAWEAATQPAKEAGIRVVMPRFGMVLSRQGGALAKMLPPFKMGFGGVVGSGKQYISWITLDDAVGVIHHAIMTDTLDGPTNAVAPQCITNAEFTKTLGKVLSRPTVFPLPAFAARLAFGEMADALLLASTRVEPAGLLASGYRFRHQELDGALRHLLDA